MASYLAQCPDELRTAILFSSFLGNQKNSVPVLYPLLSLPQTLPVGMSEESYLGAVAERVQCPLSCIYGRGYLLMVTAETRNMLYLLMQLSMWLYCCIARKKACQLLISVEVLKVQLPGNHWDMKCFLTLLNIWQTTRHPKTPLWFICGDLKWLHFKHMAQGKLPFQISRVVAEQLPWAKLQAEKY